MIVYQTYKNDKQKIEETHRGQTYVQEVRPVVDQRPTDLQTCRPADLQTCKSNRQSSPAVHPKSREIMPESPQKIMPESPQASVCLSSGRKTAQHRTEKYHQHSSPLFDRARKTSKTVCQEMSRSSSKNIKTIQQVCETHQSQTHAREVRPVVDQRPTDLQTCKSNRQSSPAVHPKSREIMPESPQKIMPESPQASVCLSSGRKTAQHRTEKYHQHSSPLFDRARKTSRTVCHEMSRSSSKTIKTIQQVCETHQDQTHVREVRPVVDQRPTDLQTCRPANPTGNQVLPYTQNREK